MVAQLQDFPKMSPDEYLAWEAEQELRYEYVDGEIIAMTGESIPHNKIALNLYRALYPYLRQRGYRVNVMGVKVHGKKSRRYFYPDLVVTCNSEDLNATDYIRYPLIIVEVLSPGTAGYDYGKKFKYYRRIESLQEYILIDSESVSVETYQRGEGRLWLYKAYIENETIHLQSIDFALSLADLYEGITFEPEEDRNNSLQESS